MFWRFFKNKLSANFRLHKIIMKAPNDKYAKNVGTEFIKIQIVC